MRSISSGLALSLFVAAAAAGCSNLLGLDDPRLTDGGDVSGDGPGPDAPPNTVVGRSFNRLTSAAAGTVDVPIDNSATLIAAFLPDPAEPTGYRVINGTGAADGSFMIDGVPDGQPYLLKLGRTYYMTSAHTITQHFEMPTRNMPATATGATPVTFQLGNMTPFVNGPEDTSDGIELYSFGIAYQGYATLDHGATGFNLEYDWRDGYGLIFGGVPLPSAELGDDLHVFHTRLSTLRGPSNRAIQFSRILDWHDGGLVTVQDLTASTITGSFTPAPNNKSLAINYTRGAFDGAYAGNGAISQSISIIAHPVGNDFAYGATLLGLSMYDWSRSTSTSMILSVSYADPLPSSWQRLLYEQYGVQRWYLLPGTTQPRPSFNGGTSRIRSLPSATPSFQPTLQPPAMIRIDGQDGHAGGLVAFEGVKPLKVTWAPVASAKLYQVLVFRVFANGAQTRTQIAASLYTEGTSIDIPAEVFSGSEFFTFTVASIASPVDYAGGVVTPNGLPAGQATVPLGMFRLSSLCGNSSMDTGEQCDEGAATPTCDVDCTLRQCGDGLRNNAAGEACDTVVNTLVCDADCTLPVCGDGHLNGQVEDCDDGNAIDDANGCSAQCKWNNVCGDGTLQPIFEQCDTGGFSATCDDDCTVAECGDGHLNPLANEQCDLGFSNGGAGCNGDCTLPP